MSKHTRLFCSERVHSVLLKVAPFRLNLAQSEVWYKGYRIRLAVSLTHSRVSTQSAAISLSSGLPTNDRYKAGPGSGDQAQDT